MLIGAQKDKPSLRAWCWERDQPLHKFSGPEKLPVLACTPDGSFCVGGGASGKLFVWQVCWRRIRSKIYSVPCVWVGRPKKKKRGGGG